ncbi:hypothetical protein SLE2022_365380 [Rubroshorea leprosula]
MEYKLLFITMIFAIVYQVLCMHVVARQILTRNRHSLKTIKTRFGDIYDCIDVYKQPALSHPLLKNHKIQMNPSSVLLEGLESSFKTMPSSSKINQAKLEEIGCPEGSVPILRKNKSMLKAEANLWGFESKYQATGYDYAGIIMKPNNGEKITGAKARLELYQPYVEDQQFSASMILLQSGSTDNNASIHVGWMVNKDYFHDTQTRFFSSWSQTNNRKESACYNNDCHVFLQTSYKYSLGAIFSNVSKINEMQYVVPMSLVLDTEAKAWWLYIFDTPLGYWPAELLNNLKDGADLAFMGGMVFSNKPYSPPMGSGQDFGNGSFDKTCYMDQVTVEKSGSQFMDPSGLTVEIKNSRCYHAGNNRYFDDKNGYMFAFGGPGGDFAKCAH